MNKVAVDLPCPPEGQNIANVPQSDDRYSIAKCLLHRKKVETDGGARIAYDFCAFRYLDAFIAERELLREVLAEAADVITNAPFFDGDQHMVDKIDIALGRRSSRSSAVEPRVKP